MYQLPNLQYPYNGLEPFLFAQTVDVHYNNHHQGYLNKLNRLLRSIQYDYSHSLEWLIQNIDTVPFDKRDDILYNAMAVSNHNIYWESMNARHTLPSGKLKLAIDQKYGSYDGFVKEFKKEARTLVGSGYTFLVMNQKGELNIMNLSNQDSPYAYGFIPLLALDLWEHSYYLDYLNKRNDYIDNFFSMIDFEAANKKYAQEN